MRFARDYWIAHNPPTTVEPVSQMFFNSSHDLIVPIDYPVIEPNSYEFWTVAEESLRQMQLSFQRHKLARSAPIKDASSDSDSDSDYAPSKEEEDEDHEDVSEEDEFI